LGGLKQLIGKIIPCFFLLLSGNASVSAQDFIEDSSVSSVEEYRHAPDSSDQYLVAGINITGNKRTHPSIILRELSLGTGESLTLGELARKFRESRMQLMNTGLFRQVIVSVNSILKKEILIAVQVEERWYIWPKPFLRTVDQSFNQWWAGDRDMNRLNYGMRFTHNNFTGRNDKLKLDLMNGFTRQLSVQYYGLYIDPSLRWSVNGGVKMGKNREVNYATENDRTVAVKDPQQFLRTYMSWFGEVSYRKAIKTRHSLSVGYNYEELADTVFALNPGYSPRTGIIHYPEITYTLRYTDLDFIPYPTRGYAGEFSLKKKGFNEAIQLWQFNLRGSANWPVGKNFLSLRGVAMLRLPLTQPYISRQFLGYEDQYIQGYEKYVVDGVGGGYARILLTRPVLNTRIRLDPAKWRGLAQIPVKLFLKTFVNGGYVYSRHHGINELTNQFLYSGGIGLDILCFTDFVIKLEWTFNRLGENGLYLHRRNNF
jgi:outer membrane protein assembly factor BamA